MSKEFEELRVWFKKELNDKISCQTKTLMDTMTTNTARSIQNEKDISQLKEAIDRIESNTSGQRSYASTASTSRAPLTSMVQVKASQPDETAAFLLSRRSLRLWPIDGEDEKQMRDAVVAFCCQALGAPRKVGIGIK